MSSVIPLHLAQAGIGAVWVGIPAHSVVRAIAMPSTAAVLPRRQGALVAVIDHEGQLVPVIDLARWVDVGAAAQEPGGAASARVLVLHAAGRTIGLKVDTVGALAEVASHEVTRLHHDDGDEEVFHSAVREPASGRILSLLDVERLARLAAVWHQGPDPVTSAAAASESPLAETLAARSCALLQVGAARVALATDALTEVLPMPPLDVLGAGSGIAYCSWRGRHLPVLTLAALGLEPAADGAAPALLAVVERAGLALGLPVHAALGLQTFDTDGRAPPDTLLSTCFEPDGAPVRMLDDVQLFARFPEAGLSRAAGAGQGAHPGQRPAAGRADGERGANATAYIVFEGDGMYAAPIDTVERVVSLRTAATDGHGAMAWEGRPIRMHDLRAGGAGAAEGDVMVVRSGDAHVGYVVARVHLLVPPGSGRIYRMGAAGAGWQFIATGDSAAQASYRIVDLNTLAA